MTFENDLHDWYLDGIMLRDHAGSSEITLNVHFDDSRKEIRLKDTTRCLVTNFLICNIIFEAKIVSADEEPEFYKEETARLNESDQANLAGALPRIFCISPSLGAAVTIEFGDIDVHDLI
jgi:hypothetical protein